MPRPRLSEEERIVRRKEAQKRWRERNSKKRNHRMSEDMLNWLPYQMNYTSTLKVKKGVVPHIFKTKINAAENGTKYERKKKAAEIGSPLETNNVIGECGKPSSFSSSLTKDGKTYNLKMVQICGGPSSKPRFLLLSPTLSQPPSSPTSMPVQQFKNPRTNYLFCSTVTNVNGSPKDQGGTSQPGNIPSIVPSPGLEDALSPAVEPTPLSNKSNETETNPSQISFKASAVLEVVVIDLLGPFTEAISGADRFILTVVDLFSRWPSAYVLSDGSPRQIARSLRSFIYTHGTPERIVSHRECAIVEEINNELCTLLGCAGSGHQFVHHSQTNGFGEINGQVKNEITECVSKHENDWGEFLEEIVFSLRCRVDSGTSKSPFHLMYGRQVKLPLDRLVKTERLTVEEGSLSSLEGSEVHSHREYVLLNETPADSPQLIKAEMEERDPLDTAGMVMKCRLPPLKAPVVLPSTNETRQKVYRAPRLKASRPRISAAQHQTVLREDPLMSNLTLDQLDQSTTCQDQPSPSFTLTAQTIDTRQKVCRAPRLKAAKPRILAAQTLFQGGAKITTDLTSDRHNRLTTSQDQPSPSFEFIKIEEPQYSDSEYSAGESSREGKDVQPFDLEVMEVDIKEEPLSDPEESSSHSKKRRRKQVLGAYNNESLSYVQSDCI